MPTKQRGRGTHGGGRERLLAVATKLFGVKGYAATSVREVLKAAGVTAPVLYYHFGNKEGLFVGMLRHALETLEAEEARAVSGASSPRERVRAFCQAHLAFRQRHAHALWISEALLAGQTEVAPGFDFKGAFTAMVKRLDGLVETAIETGAFRPCNSTAAAFVLLGALQAANQLRLIQPRLKGSPGSPEAVLETALDGLRPPPRTGGARRTEARKRRGAA